MEPIAPACGATEHADCSNPEHERLEASAQAAQTNASTLGTELTGLVRVEHPASVCMLSDRYLGDRPAVAVEAEGHTYQGCCANCAARLGANAQLRQAIDPISGHVVDKATAVLARDANNKLFYFENEASFASAQSKASATHVD